jgi:hypothetical protein
MLIACKEKWCANIKKLSNTPCKQSRHTYNNHFLGDVISDPRIDGSIAKKVCQWYICTWETESGKYIWKSLSYHNIYHFRVCFDIVPMAQRIRISWDQHNFHTSNRQRPTRLVRKKAIQRYVIYSMVEISKAEFFIRPIPNLQLVEVQMLENITSSWLMTL